MSAIELSDDYTNMLLNTPPETWNDHLDELDYPGYESVIAGVIGDVVTFAFSDATADLIIDTLLGIIELSDDLVFFLKEIYLPEVTN